MFFFRLLSLLLLAAALMFLGADAVTSLEEGQIALRMTADVLGMIPGLEAASVAAWPDAMGWAPGWAVDALRFTLVSTPAWASLGALGLVLGLLFRHRG